MLCCSESDWFKPYDLHPIFCCPRSTLLHPVLSSSFPPWQDFSKRASFPIVHHDWFYWKAVWGVVKIWEFEGNLRCSKNLGTFREKSLEWVLSISRDYWVYLDITCKNLEISVFWVWVWGIETFHRSKFSPATGVTPQPRGKNTVKRNSKRRIPRMSLENQRLFTGANLVVRPA